MPGGPPGDARPAGPRDEQLAPPPAPTRLGPARVVAENFAALDVLDELNRSGGEATGEQRAVLGRWHGWGAAPQLFDRPEYESERRRLRERLGPSGYDAASRTTLNAHYTDARLIEAIWQAVGGLGLTGGVFLEPGCGRGSFIEAAPPGFSGVGVELDPTTAAIAAALLDRRHRVINGDFAKLRLQPHSVGVAVGNVPFGRYPLSDPEHNPGLRFSIHDHFVIKSLAALTPGGVALVISSRYSLDKGTALARKAMGDRADFVGAVRLSSNAHEQAAGTRVVTDVLVFRARPEGQAASHARGFVDPPQPLPGAARSLLVSAYFAEHPEQVLGKMGIGSGPYGEDLVVDSDAPPGTGLLEALERVVTARPRLQVATRLGSGIDQVFRPESTAKAPIGRIERAPGGFRRCTPEGWVVHDAGGQAAELSQLIAIGELARSLVELESVTPIGDEDLEARRAELAASYRRYVARHGPINRVRVNETSGRRSYPRLGGFRDDPDWPRVAALELYDESSGAARPAALLERRVVLPHEPATSADSPADALSVSLAERGRVDLALIAELLGIEEERVLGSLGELVYRDPESNMIVTAAEYLSGNVRRKLRSAERTAESDVGLERNVAALSAVVPRDVTAGELEGLVGAPWVPVEVVTAFARQLAPPGSTAEQIEVARAASLNQWAVSAPRWVRDRLGRGHPFGTMSKDTLELLESLLNGRTPVVTVELEDGTRVMDPEATATACEKASELRDEFDRWLLRDDPERSAEMLSIYNERFNAYVPRNYSGIRIAAPGLASDFELRPHQHQAIARVILGGNTALWHPVGAGKTAEMIVSGMEMRRLGIVRRPCYVVPNHMLEQFSGDFLRLYPAAEVLAVSKDQVSPQARHLFAARARSHDWDAVVITHSSFVRWAMAGETQARLIEAKLAERRSELQSMSDAGGGAATRTVTKHLERRLAAEEAKLDELRTRIASHQDEHDFPFDSSGIDYLYVDEADEFKNGELYSMVRNLRGVPTGVGSQRANELDLKLRYLRERHPERQLTLATGTPISNTVAELWVATRYLRPDLLEEHGVESFDGFRAVFCDTTSDMELDMARTYRRVERLSRYKNLPELARLLDEFADIVTIDELDLPRPELATGARQVVVVPPAPQLEEFISAEVRSRVEAIRGGGVDPREDNMLKLSSECRLASFDWETYRGEAVPEEHSILAAAARKIGAIYRDNESRVYLSEIGTPHPRTGAFQLVFCDLGTPKAERADTAYDRLRSLIATEGVPTEKIAFVHERDKDDEDKARFFAACRDGRVAVAIASTPKMGMGTNVQTRLVAGHHLDAPWRPRDVEQREGRWLRQGNQNPTVACYAYVVERSFAVYGWQTLERKAGFVGQILRADPDGPRALEVHDKEALSYAEVKAIATGDEAFLELARLDDTVNRLERSQRGHAREQAAAAARHEQLGRRVARLMTEQEELAPHAAAVRAAAERGHPWRVEVAGVSYDNRSEAARALAPLLGYGTRRVLRFPDAGIEVEWRQQYGMGELVGLVGTRHATVTVEDRRHDGLVGALTRLSNTVEGLPRRLGQLHAEEQDVALQLDQTRGAGGEAFAHSDELRQARRRADALRRELTERYGDDRGAGRPASAEPVEASAIDPANSRQHIGALRTQLAAITGLGETPELAQRASSTAAALGDESAHRVLIDEEEHSEAAYLARQPTGLGAGYIGGGAAGAVGRSLEAEIAPD